MTSKKEEMNNSIAERKLLLPNGLELAYYDSCEGAGKTNADQATIVLLHGFCGSSAYWEQIVPKLSERYRVIVPDGRGHGRSAAPSDAVYTMELYADDMAEMLRALKINKAIILGHSLGGYITLAFAERFPEMLAAFGLIHSMALEDSETAKLGRDKAVMSLQQDGVASFVDVLVPKLFAAGAAAEAGIRRAKEIGYGTSLHGAQATARGMKARPDRVSVVKQSELPVLLVAGTNDAIVAPAQTFTAAGQTSVTIELSGAGHMSMLEQPEELAVVIDRFAAGAINRG